MLFGEILLTGCGGDDIIKSILKSSCLYKKCYGKVRDHSYEKILIITLFASMFFQITSYAEPMDKYKGFGDVFNETIGTSDGQIEYGMICFPDTGVNRTSNIEENDLKKLIELYADAEGECVTAPFGTAYTP